ncbi:hypothetical protein VUR80DRAFT_1671 [Thermomyces stellatus]
MSSLLSSWLPPSNGILPYYMALLSIISIGNSVQNLLTLHYTRRTYNGLFTPNTSLPAATAADSVNKLVPAPSPAHKGATDQVTPLAARLFGTWTLVTSVVRLYAAYNLHLGPVYDMAIWTYVVALGHFASELLVFKTMTFGKPQFFPFLFATTALVWMPMVRDYYVQV